jgi:hypothetical protein
MGQKTAPSKENYYQEKQMNLKPSKEESVKSLIAQYPYWFVWILNEDDNPTIMHISSFREMPPVSALQKVKTDLMNNPNMKAPPEIVQKLECAQISVEDATKLIMENLDEMIYEQSGLTE